MNRYAVINEKNPREIALLVGRGCFWQKCTFCDYHLDKQPDATQALELNKQVLNQITGRFARLEIINSGSVFELDEQTMDCILQTCTAQGIRTVHFESHYAYHKRISALKQRFAAQGVAAKFKIGIESFDEQLREVVLCKGMGQVNAQQIAAHFDECCLLIGFAGQTEHSIRRDIEIALRHFERVCLNVYRPCTAPLPADKQVAAWFCEHLYPELAANPRIDILLDNTDFGVGEVIEIE